MATKGPHIAWRIAVEQYACEACGVAPGRPCITGSGNVRHEPHAARSRLASAHHWNTDLMTEQESADDGQG